MGTIIHKYSRSADEHFRGQHRFEHWYVDNQIYFLTARCRDKFPAFGSEEAKAIFWDRFDHYAHEFEYEPWVTSLLDNHWHSEGYFKKGEHLKKFMQRLHGSVAKLVNDLLPERRPKFWSDTKGEEYFDGCLRDLKQGRCTYRYILTQGERHGIVTDWRKYLHTRVDVELEVAMQRALERDAFLRGVPYKRYEQARRLRFRNASR